MGEIFISHASADTVAAAHVAEQIRRAGHRVFLDSDREDGIPPGAEWQKTLLRELRACDAVAFLNSTASQASMWCHSELVVATELGKRVYSLDLAPDLPPHPLLQALQAIRFEASVDVGIQRLTDNLGLDGLAGNTRPKWDRSRPPYPGLAAMDVPDAGVFFGRDEEIRSLLARVDGPLGRRGGDLVVVMGPSGAGKSSLACAGLAARLAAPWSGWAVAGPFEPGTRPLDRLAGRLAAVAAGQLDEGRCRDRLLGEGLAELGGWLADHAGFPARRLLITVDQAEQLATVTPPEEWGQFLAVLSAGLGAGSPVTVVLTVRSDRLDEIQHLPVIGPMIRDPFVIAPMSRPQLAAVIEGPAARAGLIFAPGLVGRLTDDAVRGSSADAVHALPLLAFTLREMYDLAAAEDRAAFTEADYERVGRIEGAISRRAEAAESALPPGSGPVLGRLLPRFVTLSEERPPASRPVPRGRLTPAEEQIARALEDQRLLTGSSDTVELTHEQLITSWPTLVQAVADHRDDLVLQARIERQANDWKHGNGELLGRDATAAAASWLTERAEPGTAHGTSGEYIRASQRAMHRRRARLAGTLAIIVVLAIAASVVAIVAGIERSNAVRQAHLAQSEVHRAQSEAIAAEATDLFAVDAPLAMLLSLQAYKRGHTPQAGSALIEAASQPLDDLLVSGSRSSGIASVAFSPDGRTLATGDNLGHVVLWDTATRRRTATLNEGCCSGVDSMAFSPDGRTLATGDYDDHVVLWDTATGRRTVTLNPGGGGLASVAFSPDGRTLATGDYDGDIVLWDTATGRRTVTLNPGGIGVASVAFSPDGRTLATGDYDGDVVLWDTATGQRTATLNQGSSFVASVAFSPDGRTLAAAGNSGVVLWDTATGRRTVTLDRGGGVGSVALSPDGRTLATGDNAGGVNLWDTATGQRTVTLYQGGGVLSGGESIVAFSPDGRTLATGDLAGQVALWLTESGQGTATLNQGSSVTSVAFSPNGRTLAAGDYAGAVGLWDTATGQRTATLNQGGQGSIVASVAFSPDGRTLATGDVGEGVPVGLWDTATGRRTATLDRGGGVNGVAFSPDGRTLATGDAGDVILWDTATGQRTVTLNEAVVTSVAFSPDGRTLAAGDYAGHVVLWYTATGQRLATLNEGSSVISVAFSPDGRTLAVGDDDGDVGLWDTATGQRLATLNEGGGFVTSVAFSPDGRTLATGDDDGDVGLWDTATGQRLATLAEGSGVNGVAFRPDDQALAIGTENGHVILLRQRLSDLNFSFFARLICGEVRSNLSLSEWKQYVPGPYQKTCPAYPARLTAPRA